MDSNTLSKEQKIRMEENKKQALAKRQQRLQNQTQQATTLTADAAALPMPKSCSNHTNTTTRSTAAGPVQRCSNHTNTTTRSTAAGPVQRSVQGTGMVTAAGNNYNRPVGTSSSAVQRRTDPAPHHSGNSGPWLKGNKAQYSNQRGGIQKDKFYGHAPAVLKGECTLISKERFEVKIGFSQPVVEVFKTISSRVYDAAKRNWNFNIRDHGALLKAMDGLRPTVQIEPLPRAVLQVFVAKAGTEKADVTYIPQAELSQVDPVLVNSLMPFQREGVNFGVHLKGRVLIADDMGLGKTLQAICLACVYRNKWPLLVVTPSSVRFDWAQQFRRWVPSLDPQRIQVAVTGRDNPASGLVNIISYDLLSRKVKELTAARFRVIIMDESHLLKNHKTVRTKAALPLLQSAQHAILLSGTPALSRPVELYTQIVAICPRMFKFHDFGLRYCEGKEQQWGWDYSGSSNMGELQLLLEERVMIRRLKHDVLSQLPAKRRQMVVLDPVSVASSRSLAQASKVMEKNLKGMEKRGALLQYFHETCKVKIAAVRDYVLDLVAAQKKFLIFAHHQEMLDSIEDAVVKENVQYIRIDGRTTSEQRHFFCRNFQTKEECKVAVLSITAANAGLNLAAASTVVFAELFWNPGILVQAEDRAHRLGQQDSVLVSYLVAQKTADDYVWPLVQNKLQVLNRAGLAGDDFTSTDTAHAKDPRQRRLMDMFEESFLEESMCEDKTEDMVTSSGIAAEPPSNVLFSSPSKRNYVRSPPKRKKLTPSKGQAGINQFFQIDSIHTTSPRKVTESGSGPHKRPLSFPRFNAAQELDDQRESRVERQEGDESVKDSARDMPLSEWDSEMGEETLAALAADVDWEDDFEDEPDVKKIKTGSSDDW